MDPATRTVILDSMKMMTPSIQARTWALRPSSTQWRSSTHRTNPLTPPFASTRAIRDPIAKVNMMTRALPGSVTVVTAASTAPARPAIGFHPRMMVHPIQIPAARDR
jgi:hypothetical protein